jgi:hypothetical protein
MIRARLTGWGIHCDTVNPKQLELLAAKEMLAELCDIQPNQVDMIIKQRITESPLLKREIKLYADYRKPHLS